MKMNLPLSLLILIISSSIFAQPTVITWQGKLLDAGGNAITNPALAMTFAMYDAETGGIKIWPDAATVSKNVDVKQGLYTVQLGTGVGADIAFTAALFAGKTPWLEVTVDGSALPRTPVVNVPFALISNELSATGWEKPGEIGKTTPNTAKFTALETESIKITSGSGDGKVLSSDPNGDATWKTLTPSDIGAASAIHAHDAATTSAAGFMSAADKLKLDGLKILPADAGSGDIAYFDGTSWKKVVAPVNDNMVLTYCDGKPSWTSSGFCPVAVGDFAHGGVVFYIFQPGDPGYVAGEQHGLVVAITDQGGESNWCLQDDAYNVIGTGTGIGTGATNTAAIVLRIFTPGIATRICNDHLLNGYTDWFLPSKDELNLMYVNKNLINTTAVANGGSVFSMLYWSSSEWTSTHAAWVQYFNTGVQGGNSKWNFGGARVRAIRAF